MLNPKGHLAGLHHDGTPMELIFKAETHIAEAVGKAELVLLLRCNPFLRGAVCPQLPSPGWSVLNAEIDGRVQAGHPSPLWLVAADGKVAEGLDAVRMVLGMIW